MANRHAKRPKFSNATDEDVSSPPVVTATDTFSDEETEDGIPRDKVFTEDHKRIFSLGNFSPREFLRFSRTCGCFLEVDDHSRREFVVIKVSSFQGDVDLVFDWCGQQNDVLSTGFKFKVVVDTLEGEVTGHKFFNDVLDLRTYIVRKVEKHHHLMFNDDHNKIFDMASIIAPDLGKKYGNFGATVSPTESGKPLVTVSLYAFHRVHYVDAFAKMLNKEVVKDYEYALTYDVSELTNLGDVSKTYKSVTDFVVFLKETVKQTLKCVFNENARLASLPSHLHE